MLSQNPAKAILLYLSPIESKPGGVIISYATNSQTAAEIEAVRGTRPAAP